MELSKAELLQEAGGHFRGKVGSLFGKRDVLSSQRTAYDGMRMSSTFLTALLVQEDLSQT